MGTPTFDFNRAIILGFSLVLKIIFENKKTEIIASWLYGIIFFNSYKGRDCINH